MYLLLSSFSHRYIVYSTTILLLYDECCFFYIFFIHYNLVVSHKAIDTILQLILSTIVDKYTDIRQGKITFWTHFVDILIIYAYPSFPSFFGNGIILSIQVGFLVTSTTFDLILCITLSFVLKTHIGLELSCFLLYQTILLIDRQLMGNNISN